MDKRKKRLIVLPVIPVLFAVFFTSCAPRYNLTVSSTTGGIISVSPTSGPFHENDIVTLTATADTSYYFTGWGNFSSWSGDYSDSREISILMPAEDLRINAGFAERDKGWTFMIYMAGDNSLSSHTVYDLNEVKEGLYAALQSGNTSLANDVKVLVLVDQYSTDDSRLYLVTPNNISELRPNFVPASNELNMADPAVLSDFVGYGLTKYPSMNNALVLWNHGGGVKSIDPLTSQSREICEDYVDGERDLLYLNEVQTALEDAAAAVGVSGPLLDIIGMDACIMGEVETAYEFRDLARYFTASMGEEWGWGWDYSRIFNHFTSPGNPPNPAAMADILVTQYRESTMIDSTTYPNTMTSVDLSKIEALKTAIDGLAESLAAEKLQSEYEALQSSNVHYYEDGDGGYADIYTFCSGITEADFGAGAAGKAEAVKIALADAVAGCYGNSSDLGLDYYETDDAAADRGLSILISYSAAHYASFCHIEEVPWYNDKTIRVRYVGSDNEFEMGGIDFCTSDTADSADGTVETWRELFEDWYDTSGIY